MTTDFTKALQHKIDTRTKPLGSLGRLEELALKIGTIQHSLTPHFTKPAMLLMAADHGIAREGVSICPQEITWQQCINFVAGGGACSVLSRQHGFKLRVVDVGVDYDFAPEHGVEDEKICYGSHNMLHTPAMTHEECERAMSVGAKKVAEEAENGCNVIAFGEMGIGNTTPASLILHKIVGTPLEQIIGPGSGLDPDGVRHKINVLSQVAEKYHPTSPTELLEQMGGLEIAAICGGVLEAYRRGMTILADGVIASSAFLIAYEIEPKILDNVIFCHKSQEPAHIAMMNYMGVEPLIDLRMRLGEGSGALVAYPILVSALTFLNEMKGFDEAQVFCVEDHRNK